MNLNVDNEIYEIKVKIAETQEGIIKDQYLEDMERLLAINRILDGRNTINPAKFIETVRYITENYTLDELSKFGSAEEFLNDIFTHSDYDLQEPTEGGEGFEGYTDEIQLFFDFFITMLNTSHTDKDDQSNL